MFDLDAYLERIGLTGRPALEALHRAHVHQIPFENLDSHGGHPVVLDLQHLQDKLVRDRRGGYCFEHNLLFKAACEALGASVDLHLSRVRWRGPAGLVRPRTHLALRVEAEGKSWHADVGFGAGTPLAPMPFGPGGPYELSGWTFRVIEDGPELVLQRLDAERWADVYAFSREPSPLVDVDTSNWWVSTNPASPMVSGLIVARRPQDGSVETLSDWSGELVLISETPQGTTREPVELHDVPGLLTERFELPGFAITDEGTVASM